MENEDGFPCFVAAYGRFRFSQAWAEEELLHGGGGVDIHSPWNMTAIILIIEPTVYDME